MTQTTYFHKDKESYTYLESEVYAGRCTAYAEQEIPTLIRAKQQGRLFEAATDKVTNGYNLNSMQAGNVYCGLKGSTKDGKLLLHVDILDLNGLMTPISFTRKVVDTHSYLDSLFDRNQIDFSYVLYTQSEERKSYIVRHQKNIENTIQNKCKQRLKLVVVNLDLERTLFKGQKVLLSV